MWDIPEIPENLDTPEDIGEKRSWSLVIRTILSELEDVTFCRLFINRYYERCYAHPRAQTVLVDPRIVNELAKLFTDKGYFAYRVKFRDGFNVSGHNEMLWITCEHWDKLEIRRNSVGYTENNKFIGSEELFPRKKGKRK